LLVNTDMCPELWLFFYFIAENSLGLTAQGIVNKLPFGTNGNHFNISVLLFIPKTDLLYVHVIGLITVTSV